MAQAFFKPDDVTFHFPHSYVRKGGAAVDAALVEQVHQAAPGIGGCRVEAGVLRTWRPLPPAVARALKLRMLR